MAQFIIVEEVQDKFASFYDAVLRELRLRRLWLIFYFFKASILSLTFFKWVNNLYHVQPIVLTQPIQYGFIFGRKT